MAPQHGRENTVHRAELSMEKQLLRELQFVKRDLAHDYYATQQWRIVSVRCAAEWRRWQLRGF